MKGILAAAIAPAIVKSSNLMNIWVPPDPEIIDNLWEVLYREEFIKGFEQQRMLLWEKLGGEVIQKTYEVVL